MLAGEQPGITANTKHAANAYIEKNGHAFVIMNNCFQTSKFTKLVEHSILGNSVQLSNDRNLVVNGLIIPQSAYIYSGLPSRDS